MPLPQFTIRDLLLSTMLIAAGIASLMLPFRKSGRFMESDPAFPFLLTIFFLSGPLIGAGLGLPFGKTRLGVTGLDFLYQVV